MIRRNLAHLIADDQRGQIAALAQQHRDCVVGQPIAPPSTGDDYRRQGMNLEQMVGWAANLIQIGSVVFTVVALWRARRALTRYLKARAQAHSERPWAWAIGVGNDVEGQVRAYLQDQGMDMPIESYAWTGFITPDDAPKIMKGLIKGRHNLDQAAVTEVHLFYKGPVTMATAIGVITDNWVPVKVYEYTHGSYQLFCVLEKETVKGMLLGDALAAGETLATITPG